MLKVVDLFSGIGGFTLGFEMSGGYETVLFCEIEERCQRILKKHWPQTSIHNDVRTLKGERILQTYGHIHVVCGGFPCQDISVSGRMAGIEGERSKLWIEMHRLIRELQPDWVLVENVSGLQNRGADRVISDLDSENYSVWPCVVGAWCVGAKQERNRAWILAHNNRYGRISSEIIGSIETSIHDTQNRTQRAFYFKRASSVSGSERVMAGTIWPTAKGFEQPDWEPRRTVKSGMVRTSYGLSGRVDRIKMLGNTVVPEIPMLFAEFILSAPICD